MTIGKIAKRTSLNVQTIRFYERAGLLEEAQRTPSGYRQFEENTVERIQFIRKAQKIGYSLEEIKELLFLRVSEESPCDRMRLMTEVKIVEINEKMRDLRDLKSRLERLVGQCEAGGPEGNCPILESLN